MTFRSKVLLYCACLVAGCDPFDMFPGGFSVGAGAPAGYRFEADPTIVLTCSVSDPVIAMSLRNVGCHDDYWTVGIGPVAPYHADWEVVPGANRDVVATTSLDRGTLVPQELRASCDWNPNRSVTYSIPVQADLPGYDDRPIIESSIEQLRFLGGNTEVVAVSDSRVAIVPNPFRASEAKPSRVFVHGVGSPLLTMIDDDVVVSGTCREDWCAGGNVLLSLPHGGTQLASHAFANSELLLSVLGKTNDDRVLVQTFTAAGGRILSFDAALEDEREIAIPGFTLGPQSAPRAVRVDGALVWVTTGSYEGDSEASALFVVRVDGAGSATATPFAEEPDGLSSIAMAPHGDRAIWVERSTGVCRMTSRSLKDPIPVWTYAACPSELTFLDDRAIFADTSGGVYALNLETGALAWQFRVGEGRVVSALTASGDHVIATTKDSTGRSGVLVFSKDGSLTFGQLRVPGAAVETFLSPGDGSLYAARSGHLVRIATADESFAAPPTVCSRVDCGEGVTDLATDSANCGRCGVRCGEKEACVMGECHAE